MAYHEYQTPTGLRRQHQNGRRASRRDLDAAYYAAQPYAHYWYQLAGSLSRQLLDEGITEQNLREACGMYESGKTLSPQQYAGAYERALKALEDSEKPAGEWTIEELAHAMEYRP